MEDKTIIPNELGAIKQNIIALREELADRTLTSDDLIAIENYREEKNNDALISHEDLKKELDDVDN